ncbi:MAG: nitrile hydratase subunit beta [Gammaproteobacteria bacterium]
MNGIHDLGGMDNLGPIVREQDEPVFHEDWERQIFSLTIALMASGYFQTDEIRRTIELIPPARYLQASYYERWLHGLERILVEKEILTRGEIDTGNPQRRKGGTVLPPISKENIQYAMTNNLPVNLDMDLEPGFAIGDHIIAKNINPFHYIRLPRYIRGKRGIIERDHGIFALPDTIPDGGPDKPQHVYNVRFSAQELWGADASPQDSVYIDLFDDYMDLLG